jgi:tetratricopeptide (TPR) repeat protein
MSDSGTPSASTDAADHEPPTLPPAPAGSGEAATLPARPTRPIEPAPVGQVANLPGYEIVKELGRGGMGVVYLARQPQLNRLVALKMILAGGHASPADLTRFRTEAEAIARLQHTNIVQIHEIGDHNGLPYFSLEFCDGGSLKEKLSGTPLPPNEAAALVETLARAMDAAHQKGVIHRDLKPANILLQTTDHTDDTDKEEKRERLPSSVPSVSSVVCSVPKITDFGLAKRLDAAGQTATGAVMGTPSYMAPEQAGGQGHMVGPLADVYSLGAILYECLTGRPPFKAATPLDTVLQVVSDDPVPPTRLQPKTPRDLETICLKCLQKEPAKRYPSSQALAEDLRRFREGWPISARPIGLAERGVKWARRRPAVAALLGVLFVVVTAAFAGMAVLWLRAEEQRRLADDARAEAEDAADRARQHEELARRQKQRAETSYRLARTALDKALQLEKDPRFHQGELEDVRRKLLTAAVSFYEEFVQLQSDDPLFQRERAAAFYDLGHASEALGSKKEALAAYERALGIYDQLVRDQPAEVDDRVNQARAQNDLGNVYDMLGRPGEAEKAFLRAHAMWQRLTQDVPGTSYYKDRLATALHNLAIVYRHTSRPHDAEDAIRRAVVLRDELVRAEPDNAAYKCELAYSRFNLGVLYCTSNRLKEAERPLVQARDLYQEVVQKQPHDEDALAGLAMANNSLGILYTDTDRMKEGEKALNESLGLKERLVKDHPAVIKYQEDLANSYNNLGILYLQTGRLDQSAVVQQKSLAIKQRLLERNPGDVGLAVALGGSCCNLGLALRDQKKNAEALVWFGKAVDTLEGVLKWQPRHLVGRDFLLKSYAGRAAALEALERYAEAQADWDQALTYARDEERPGLRLRRALALAHSGKYAEAAREADGLGRLPQLPGLVLYNLACVHALCARDKERADRQAGRTLELLRRAQATGYFRAPANREHFRKDPDFDAVRGRAEFAKFLKSMEQGP